MIFEPAVILSAVYFDGSQFSLLFVDTLVDNYSLDNFTVE